MIITNENIFLIVLGLVWIVGAVMQDLRRREVDNIWNFSLIGFALAYRLAVSVFGGNYWFVLNGLIGFVVFLVLGNLFYYSRLFAGGDAKLVIALGAVLPLSYDWIVNFKIFGLFILLFMVGGSIYSLFYSGFLVFGNFRGFNEAFIKGFRDYFRLFVFVIVLSICWGIFVFFVGYAELMLISFVILLFPVLLVFSKAVEKSCLVKKIEYLDVTEGDWLCEGVKVGRGLVKPSWEGVSGRDLELIRKYKKDVLVKYGIPFTPAFLIGFVGVLIMSWRGIGGL